MPTKTAVSALDRLIEAWERQQDAYVRYRDQRFQVALDAIEYARPSITSVLDIAGGLGSFSKLVLERFPNVEVTTLDYDPALLELARHNLAPYGDRSTIVEANLVDSDWTAALNGSVPDVVISSTALHWLSAPELTALYHRLAALLSDGGLVLNADHLSQCRDASFFHVVSTADDAAQQQAGFSGGAPDWDVWWRQLGAVDGFAELIAERDRRFAGGSDIDLSPEFHTEALAVSGFSETGTIWQYFDDYVVYGVR